MSKGTRDELPSIMITKDTPTRYVEKLSSECRMCASCCRYDSGIFLDQDIERISGRLGVPEEDFRKRFLEVRQIYNKNVHKAKLKRDKKPYGQCIFLEGSECSIHDFKPDHCRLATGCGEHGQEINIWFMLNFVLDPDDPQAIREWAQYLKTHPTIQGGNLHELVPDRKRLERILSYDILK